MDGNDNSIPDIMQYVMMSLITNANCARNWGRLPAGTICASFPGKE